MNWKGIFWPWATIREVVEVMNEQRQWLDEAVEVVEQQRQLLNELAAALEEKDQLILSQSHDLEYQRDLTKRFAAEWEKEVKCRLLLEEASWYRQKRDKNGRFSKK